MKSKYEFLNCLKINERLRKKLIDLKIQSIDEILYFTQDELLKIGGIDYWLLIHALSEYQGIEDYNYTKQYEELVLYQPISILTLNNDVLDNLRIYKIETISDLLNLDIKCICKNKYTEEIFEINGITTVFDLLNLGINDFEYLKKINIRIYEELIKQLYGYNRANKNIMCLTNKEYTEENVKKIF